MQKRQSLFLIEIRVNFLGDCQKHDSECNMGECREKYCNASGKSKLHIDVQK